MSDANNFGKGKSPRNERFQFVWWPYRWWKLWPKSVGPYPSDGEHKGKIYSWRIVFGPLEIRCWGGLKRQLDRLEKAMVLAFLLSCSIHWKENVDCSQWAEVPTVHVNALTNEGEIQKLLVRKVCLEDHHATMKNEKVETMAEVKEIMKNGCQPREGFLYLKCSDWKWEEVK